MTDQSRVEAVARALAAAANWVWDGLSDDVKDYWRELAHAAIEANDKWLAVKWTCPNCEAKHNQDAKDCWLCQTKREPNR